MFVRCVHGGAGAVHGARRAAQPRLHRHALRLLHGRQRRRLPPLRRRRRRRRRPPPRVADARVPRRLLARGALLHAAVAVRAGGARQDGAPRGVRRGRRGDGRRVPGAGGGGAAAGAVGRPGHAVGARGVGVPQRLPPRLARPPLLRPLRLLHRRRRARLRALQRARQLRRRRGRRRARRCQGARRGLQGITSFGGWLTCRDSWSSELCSRFFFSSSFLLYGVSAFFSG